jgi:phage gp36-like protein
MTYAVAQDLIDRFGLAELNQLADRVNGVAYDPNVVAQVLSDTTAEIDAALASRYDLPLTTVPTLLVGIACDLARWRLWIDSAPQRVTDAAVNARKLLAALASGAMSLGLPAVSEPVTAMRPKYAAPDAVFDSSEGF